MGTIDQQYNEALKSAKAAEASREQLASTQPGYIAPGSGVKFVLSKWLFDERPYIYGACAGCRTELRTENPEFVWRHCGGKNDIPVELKEQLEKLQIKMGLRAAKTFSERLFGKKQPAPNLNNF